MRRYNHACNHYRSSAKPKHRRKNRLKPKRSTEEPTEVAEEPVSLNPYIGSNKLNGNGVPPTFFDDVHIRRAFAYAFDWDTIISMRFIKAKPSNPKSFPCPACLALTLMPRTTTWIARNPRKSSSSLMSTKTVFPLVRTLMTSGRWASACRCSTTQGNTTRQIIAEILQQNLAAVNDKFTIQRSPRSTLAGLLSCPACSQDSDYDRRLVRRYS